MKTIHYPNKLRSHLVTIAPMMPFTPKPTSKLRSALHFTGASTGFGRGGGGQEIFFQLWKFACRFARGVGGHAPSRKKF